MSPTPSGPLVVPEPSGRPEQRASGVWQVRWRLTNQTKGALHLLEAWFPHNLYFSPRRRFDPPAESLAAGESIEAAFDITCAAPPGAVIENAFLILQATALGVRWRLLARLTVTVAEGGAPMAAVETITAQRAGFSEGGSPLPGVVGGVPQQQDLSIVLGVGQQNGCGLATSDNSTPEA